MGKDNLSGKKKYTDGKTAKYFYPGQQPEGWVLGGTEEKRLKNSEATKKLWQDDDYRNHQTETRNSDEYLSKNKEWNRKAWQDEEARKERCAKLATGAQNRFKDPEQVRLRSEQQKELWQDSEYHQNQVNSLRNGHKDIYLKHPEYLEKIAEGNRKAWEENKENILRKQAKSKSENNSWVTSQLEENYYKYLIDTYGKEDVVRQYRDARYPFNCDFYIKSLDLFIELQGTWLHNDHPFNPNNEEDLKILAEWAEKAQTSKFYKQALYVWTVSDPLKIKTAKQNNLNIQFLY